jgi:hypothetical protein
LPLVEWPTILTASRTVIPRIPFPAETAALRAPRFARVPNQSGDATMAMQEAFDEARKSGTADDAIRTLVRRGVWMADEDAMTQAVHDVYCGIMADHEQPNEKDREQARQLIAAVGQSLGVASAT